MPPVDAVDHFRGPTADKQPLEVYDPTRNEQQLWEHHLGRISGYSSGGGPREVRLGAKFYF